MDTFKDTSPQLHSILMSPTVIIFRRPIVGFIDGCSEALVAASSPDHVRARTVKWEHFVFPVNL